ncbi:hypothetical protein VCUG_01661 [Vavraia culicis subsp. floridensis]|uniref:ABC transporter domain-containing protein n=1 Tax=Vavraia culicis (isolate floridensis) TaxID=948595 RepID=L2GU81_VAVCU|nr:uncharacterized protein VCUG_01661 [Vavraia culicis subsp. floridensis]ELA46887.1 hypothetical protein VCUG_01661 [Vavraia culicis subsp. floridensis]
MKLEWKNIDIEVMNHNRRYRQKRIKLVSNACGHAKEGLLAIMGPSGSGKTTLIKALAGRLPSDSSSTGIVTLNGVERDVETWVDIVGYVDQDDAIYNTLTARETVTYAAKFRLKNRSINITEKVEGLFKKLAITHVLDCQMSNLSGGERKRVMIAVELITDPKIIFLDEPTSGLDNNTTVKIIKLLKELSKEGRTILFTIHQPDDITVDEFDEILLLSQGRSVYMGSMKNCEQHLISNGFVKEDRETFSNFAMKVLNVEPGIYHETDESGRMDSLVNEVKERYNFNASEKFNKTGNDYYVELAPNCYHIMLLLKRRCKLELFSKKNIVTVLIGVISICLILYLVRVVNNMQSEVAKEIETGFRDGTRKLPKDLRGKSIKCIQDGMKTFAVMILSIFVGFQVAIIPLLTGMAFNGEHDKIKREVSVHTYSVSSYYFAVFIFEFLRHLVLFIFFAVGIRIITGDIFDFMAILTSFMMFLATITAYLFCGSILRGMKKIILVFGSFLIINALPFAFIVVMAKMSKKITKKFLLAYLLDLTPNYVLGACSFIARLEKLLKDYPELELLEDMIADDQESFTVSSLKEYKSLLMGIELPVACNYLFGGGMIVLYAVLCIMMLSIHLKPDFRMRLNKK